MDDLRRLLASRQMETVKLGLAKLVKEIVVQPQGDSADGAVQLRLRGSVESVLRLAAGKCELGGSPGGLSARLTPTTRVTFRLSPVRGVQRDRLPEAVKSAIRFVRPAELRAVAVGAA